MTTISPRLRKFALTAHLAVSVGWIGAVVAYLALVVAAWTAADGLTVRAAWLGLAVIARNVLVPLAVASLATGIAMALGTRWGLLRHYWVAFTLVLTVVAVGVLLSHVPTVSYYASLAATGDANRAALRGELVHGGGGLAVLLLITVLNVYKPRGLTPYGRRKREARRSKSDFES